MRSFWRSLRIWRVVLLLLARLWWDGQAFTYIGGITEQRRLRRSQRLAQWLVETLLALGSAFIKLGQLLSARPDILPAAWVEELARLQDRVPPFPFSQVEQRLEKELGRTIGFRQPCPSASRPFAQWP